VAPGASGTLAIVRGDNLALIRPNGSEVAQVTQQPSGTFANNPAFSPDGLLLAYAHRVTPAGQDLGSSEIHLIKADGGDHRVLAPSREPGERLENPAWSPDGRSVYFARDVPIFDQAQRYAGDQLSIEKVDIATGTREVLVKDAIFPAAASNGDLAWVNFNLADSTFQLVFAAAGGSPRVLTDADFQSVYMPRFSPDGKRLLFGGSGRSESKVGVLGHAVARALNPLVPEPAHAHGLPWDSWVIGIDGKGLRKVTGIGLDELGMAWNPDGRFIAAANLDATYLFNADGSGFTYLLKTGDSGGIDWRRD
jgi:Tol biopolymer transport system component